MIRNSIKQMLRMPIRSISFLLLIASSSLFLTLGAVLWITNHSSIQSYENTFVTIGTIEQKAFSVKQVTKWDAEQNNYIIRQKAIYSKLFPVSLLFVEGIDYIVEPEKRSFYGSYAPEYKLRNNTETPVIIAEISPLEDCIPNESVQIKINKVLLGNTSLEGTTLWFCNQYAKNPKPLKKDKNYAVVLDLEYWAFGQQFEKTEGSNAQIREYVPLQITPTQYESDGTLINNNMLEDEVSNESPYYEVTEAFYTSTIGKAITNLVKGYNMLDTTQPVTGTNSTILLMPFYTENAYINEGRDISAEEYENGCKVCLISKKFADNNSLTIGSTLHLQLFYTNSKDSAGQVYYLNGGVIQQWMPIDSNGEALTVFEDSQYTIVGTYDISSGASQNDYSMGNDEVIVPINSIEKLNTNNIMEYGPMTGNTTSFQIPNGSIEDFLTVWEKYGTEELQITFYDMGYSQIESGLENIKRTSVILLMTGFLMIIFLLLLYCHLFITNQKERTAIELCLGVEKKKCRRSLLIAIMLLLSVGSAFGCVLGGILSQHISAENLNQVYYDTTYSNIADVETSEVAQVKNDNTVVMIVVTFASNLFIVLVGVLIAYYKTNLNLKLEPMKLLGERRNE